jgi:hypothetical protein
MNIANDVKGTIFEPKESEKKKNTVTANFSTYEGKEKDGSAKYSSWIIYFVGNAFQPAKELKTKDLIKLTNAKIENSFNKETKKNFIWITVFSFEKVEKKSKEESE